MVYFVVVITNGRRRAAPKIAEVVLSQRTRIRRSPRPMGYQTYQETGRPNGSQREEIVNAVTAPGGIANHRGRVRNRRE